MASVTVIATSWNGLSIGDAGSTGSSAGCSWYFECDKFDKLAIFGYNSDTASCNIALHAPTSTMDWVLMGKGDKTTSIGSSEYVFIGPCESARFKSSGPALYISSTGSTCSTKVHFWAFQMPTSY
jgi:hypothetical protein